MPTIAQQLRARRRHRQRRRRVAAGLLVAVPAALVGARVVADAGTDPALAAWATAVTATSTPTTSSTPTELHPGLVDAFTRAQAEAAAAGHALTITSGFRTAEEQAELLAAEIVERGSIEEAQRWVFPPDRSMHVQGLAIDVGDGPAAEWLVAEGAKYGLCQTLAWEWWHVEWREQWEADGACPPPAESP